MREARNEIATKIVSAGKRYGAPDIPPPDCGFEWIRYNSPVGPLAAHVISDPRHGKRPGDRVGHAERLQFDWRCLDAY